MPEQIILCIRQRTTKIKVVMGREEHGLNSGGKDVHKQKILVVDDSEMNREIPDHHAGG